jgi:hypothetical protein
VSVPKGAFLPKKKQDAIVKFETQHGRAPEPAEVGLSSGAVERARKAMATFVPVDEALVTGNMDYVSVPEPEADIDRKRDTLALKEFLEKLSSKDRKAFWTGERQDLTERAKRFVEGKRATR